MTAKALLGLALGAALAIPAPAAATKITIINVDSAGVGFNDPSPRTPVGGNNGTTLGEQRLNVFKYAAAFWAGQLDSPVEITVEAKFEAKACDATTATLGSAGTQYIFSDFKGAPRAATWYSMPVQTSFEYTNGSDSSPPLGHVHSSNPPSAPQAYAGRWGLAKSDRSRFRLCL